MIYIITCKQYVAIAKDRIKKEVYSFTEKPELVVLQIDHNPASDTYISGKEKDCNEVGIDFIKFNFDSSKDSQNKIVEIIQAANNDKYVNGILLQVPIPEKYDLKYLQSLISPEKDVDGFKRDSLFDPCTPKGIMDWINHNCIDLVGKNIVVVGRSEIVGKPLVKMLIDKGATVTSCNSHTKDIEDFTHNADIVITAIGKPKYFTAEYFGMSTDLIIDVGINRDENGKLCGDVNAEQTLMVYPQIYITPVPGGVGLLTRTALLDNVVKAYKMQNKIEEVVQDEDSVRSNQ